jgi:hypothetical protein
VNKKKQKNFIKFGPRWLGMRWFGAGVSGGLQVRFWIASLRSQ